MLILAIDTSTSTASISLLKNDEIVSEVFINLGVNHSIILLPALYDLCRLSCIEPSSIDLFACTIGPGSFTGLRVGASTIKGLALATGKPVVGVSTLDALAFNLVGLHMLICPILDAKKNQVYTALYRTGYNNILVKAGNERVTDIEEFLRSIDEETIFVGNGALKYADLISDILSGRSYFASTCNHHVRAAAVGLLGRKKYSEGDILDLVTFAPIYLRLSEAEMKCLSK
ncbi:MAG TPA: tRNA (adenosine(37)-N6)-threonylcarbamoyltransferase complex dimerization subunit type 1 TsaB, partial [Syntrophales bacterium]|nr:tRNA (adenosine(37)-N6)-threonylcarbamoyltransferase complex dimerization subunit type 1 TsaB [Syntrophales bacterium]